MKPIFQILAVSVVTAISAIAAHAAPRQVVLIVAEGVNPQTLSLGSEYIKTAYGADTEIAFSNLQTVGKTSPASADTLTKLRGLLKTAKSNGWKTGIVTTGDAATVGSLFYGVDGNATASAKNLVTNGAFDVLAGGGRANFAQDVLKAQSDAGNTAITDLEGLDAETKGSTLALSADADLSYALDRDVETEASLSELAALALTNLGENDAPYMLIVHDTLIAKALQSRDTPALLEQFREIDAVLADALGRREEALDSFAVGVLTTGATSVPQFATTDINARAEAFTIASQLPRSFGAAGRDLTGADDAKIKLYTTDTYKGWQLSDANRAAIAAGTLTPETAIRQSYEPALKLNFDTVTAMPMIHAVGFEPGTDLSATLQALAASKPAAMAVATP